MSASRSLATLSTTQRNQLESLLMQFDQHWKPQLLLEFCSRLETEFANEHRRLALCELVKVDLQHSWNAGEGLLLEEYFVRFSALGTTADVTTDLLLVEYQARRPSQQDLSLQSYEKRFPEQYAEFARLAALANDSHDGTQASVETSQIGVRDTTTPVKSPIEDIPQEFGRYRIIRELGAGAMGKVYLAHDTQVDRQVAIKTPSFGRADDEDLIERFYREARAAGALHHRNICPIHDVGEINGRHFMCMGYINGRTLAEFIRPDKLPTPRQTALLTHRLALALAEAHRHNVIHRDLKPANIMIDRESHPIVMDFGLARRTDTQTRITQSGMLVGTPAYMSPEQVSGIQDDVGSAADIYSLGVILYELLTGDIPFRGGIAQVVHQITSVEPTPPTEVRDGIDAGLEVICLKMMAKNRGQRYESMEEVAAALKTWLKAHPSIPNVASSRARKSAGRSDSSKAATETAVLGEFFAQQDDPRRTTVEPSVVRKLPDYQKRKARQYSRAIPRTLWIGAALTGMMILTLGIMLLVRTRYGTIRVELDDPSLNIVIDGERLSVEDLQGPIELVAGPHTFQIEANGERITPGDVLEIATGKDGRIVATLDNVQLEAEEFVVSSKGSQILRVSLEFNGSDPSGSANQAVEGLAKPGLQFNGTSSFVSIPSMRISGAAPLTMEVLLTPWRSPHPQLVCGDVQHGGWALYIGPDGRAFIHVHNGTAYASITSDEQQITFGECVHLLMQWDGKRVALYVNGTRQAQNLDLLSFRRSEFSWTLGCNRDKRKRVSYFFGILHEIRVSRSIRYHSNFQPADRMESDTATVLHYRLDKETHGTIEDLSGHGHTGTIVNARWVNGS